MQMISRAFVAAGAVAVFTGLGMAQGPRLIQPGGTYYETAPPVYQAPTYEYETRRYETTPVPTPELGEVVPLPESMQYQEVIPYETYRGPAIGHLQPGPELYTKVVYKDEHCKAPGAIPYLVEVPLYKPILPRRRARYCGPDCASILICVPPCDVPRVRVTRRGHKLRYDFGKYEVDVVVRRDGRVIVDYDA